MKIVLQLCLKFYGFMGSLFSISNFHFSGSNYSELPYL